ncbi:MAG TPA: hypothetical protein VF299_01250 [Mycobacterium sp.]
MRRFDVVWLVGLALRLSLAAAFLSAVADRFGWLGPIGPGPLGTIAWGGMGPFTDYTHQLVPFASGVLLAVIAWTASLAELILGLLLLIGWWPRLVGVASCVLLAVFAIAMTTALGIKAPLAYSVFTAASAAAAYAVLAGPALSPVTSTPSVDTDPGH